MDAQGAVREGPAEMGNVAVTKDFSELLHETELIARGLSQGLPDGFDIAMLTLNTKLPFKALSYREALFHRFADLSMSAVESISANRPVSAATLTRGGMETMARTLELEHKLQKYLLNPSETDLDGFLMNRLFGANNNPDLPEATNILGAIDRATKHIPNFRENYDRLSEFAHPNYAGTFRTFVKIDQMNFKVHLSDAGRIRAALMMILFSLSGTLHGFCIFYDNLADTIVSLNSHLEKQLADKP